MVTLHSAAHVKLALPARPWLLLALIA